MLGLNKADFYFMPKGELSDLIDAKSILLGLADEELPLTEDEYFDLK